jgi:hypothetical protein
MFTHYQWIQAKIRQNVFLTTFTEVEFTKIIMTNISIFCQLASYLRFPSTKGLAYGFLCQR